MISLAAVVIAFVAYSLNQDLACSMDSFHTLAGLTLGFASVTAFASKYSVAELALALELVPVTDAISLEKNAHI